MHVRLSKTDDIANEYVYIDSDPTTSQDDDDDDEREEKNVDKKEWRKHTETHIHRVSWTFAITIYFTVGFVLFFFFFPSTRIDRPNISKTQTAREKYLLIERKLAIFFFSRFS